MSFLVPSNPNAISLLWIGLFVYGLVVGYLNAREARADRQYISQGPTGGQRRRLYRLQATAELIIEVTRVTAQSIGLIIGVISIYVPPLPQVHLTGALAERRVFYSIIVIVGLLLLEFAQDVVITTEFVRRRRAHQIAAQILDEQVTWPTKT